MSGVLACVVLSCPVLARARIVCCSLVLLLTRLCHDSRRAEPCLEVSKVCNITPQNMGPAGLDCVLLFPEPK
jgi:hypothetical protein